MSENSKNNHEKHVAVGLAVLITHVACTLSTIENWPNIALGLFKVQFMLTNGLRFRFQSSVYD